MVCLARPHSDVTYDAWNRLVLVTEGDASTRLEYDGLGRRIVKRTFSGNQLDEARHYYYDVEGRVLSEWVEVHLAPGPSPKPLLPEPMIRLEREYVWGPRGPRDLILRDRRLIVSDGAQETVKKERLYALEDPQFNVTGIVEFTLDERGMPQPEVVEEYLYDPYGGFLVRAEVDGQPKLFDASPRDWNLLLGSNLFDAETGLYSLAGRPYHPGLGRGLVGGTLGPMPESALNALVETPESWSWGLPQQTGSQPGFAPLDDTSFGAGLAWGVGETVGVGIVVIGGITVLATFTPIGALALGIGLLAVGTTAAGMSRVEAGQTWSQVATGTIWDITGLSGVAAGLYGIDIATGKQLHLSEIERGRALGAGVGSLLTLRYGMRASKYIYGGTNVMRGRITDALAKPNGLSSLPPYLRHVPRPILRRVGHRPWERDVMTAGKWASRAKEQGLEPTYQTLIESDLVNGNVL